MPAPTDSLEPAGKERSKGLIRDFLTGLSFPVLFLVLAGLFVADAFFPDPLPFIDEAILGSLAVMLGAWRRKRQDRKRKDGGVSHPSP